MNLSTRHRSLTALFMSVVMIIASLPLGAVHAGMVTTETMISQQATDITAPDQTHASRDRIRDLLARGDVRDEMIALGITPVEAEARIAALTDQEINDIAGRLDQLPAGEGVGTILITLFVVFGVAVLLDALGLMDIFPFVCGRGTCGAQQQVQAYYPEPAAGPVHTEPYIYEERQPAYRRDQFNRSSSRNQARGYDSNQYYEPQPQTPPARNYFEERYGSQRYVR